MRGNVFIGLVMVLVGFLFFIIGMRRRGEEFIKVLQQK